MAEVGSAKCAVKFKSCMFSLKKISSMTYKNYSNVEYSDFLYVVILFFSYKGFSNRDITISYLYMNAPLNFFNELSMSKR